MTSAEQKLKHERVPKLPNINPPRINLTEAYLKPRLKKENLERALNKTERSLITWEKQTEDRKREQEKLAKNLHRNVDSLVLHDGDKMRAKVERRKIIEHANVEKKASVRCGLWELPARLFNPCYGDAEYLATSNRIEKGEVPSMTYVGTPLPIQEDEQGINEIKERCHGFSKSEYMKRREKELGPKIVLLEPHRPDYSQLIIIGKRPKVPEIKIDVPPIEIEQSFSQYCPLNIISDVYALQINSTIFFKMNRDHSSVHFRKMQFESWHQELKEWYYYFNTPVNVRQRKTIFLRNLGTVAIRYCWHAERNFLSYLPNVNLPPVFFFNKNESIISPGQAREIKIDCFSNSPGIYKEKWEFKPGNVDFFKKREKLFIYLDADIVEDDIDELESLKQKILNSQYEAARNSFMKQMLHKILNNVFKPMPEFYPYKHLLEEKDSFLFLNPKCFYHQNILKSLKELHAAYKDDPWDLSLKTLRNFIKTLPFEERIPTTEIIKFNYQTLLRPVHEDLTLQERKYRAAKEIMSQLIDSFYEIETFVFETSFIYDEIPVKKRFACLIREQIDTTIENIATTLASLDVYRHVHFTLK